MVPCTLGRGSHRYLGAILTAAEHAAAAPNNTPPFADPLFPGATAIIPPNSTGPQIAAINRQFNKELCQWMEYKNLTNAGKKFIQDSIDDMYLKGITDRNVGLAHITIREILAFLFQNYRNITQYDIKENDKKLKEKWDANTPIEMLFDQIDDAQGMQQQPGNCTQVTNYLPLPTTSYTQRASFLMIAKLGISSQQTRKQWTTSKQLFNKPNKNYVINSGLCNKLASKPMGFGANPPRTMTIPSRKQPKHLQTWPQQLHLTDKCCKT